MGPWLGIQTQCSNYIPLKEWAVNFVNKFWKEDGIESDRGLCFCAILWAVWLHRNNVVFPNLKQNPYEILHRAEELVEGERDRMEGRHDIRKKNPPNTSNEEIEVKFIVGICREIICIITVDGAWKRVKKKNCPKAGIGWNARVGSNIVFKGNSVIKANSATM